MAACHSTVHLETVRSVTETRVAMTPTLLSLSTPEVVVTTTSGATSDGKVGIKITLGFQYNGLVITVDCPVKLDTIDPLPQNNINV